MAKPVAQPANPDDGVAAVLKMRPHTPPPGQEAKCKEYLQHLRNAYRALDFRGIPQLDNFSRELLLEDVYVPLLAQPDLPPGETWERRVGRVAGRLLAGDELPGAAAAAVRLQDAGPLPVEQALARKERVVVAGDPGSGKSTLLKHLALRLAAEKGAPLPIILPLNAYAEELLQHPGARLQPYLAAYFANLPTPVPGLTSVFDSAIARGQALILLDGLDEVQRGRDALLAQVEAFARQAAHCHCRVLVTSRIVGYREAPLDPKAWALYTLRDFDRPAIEQFAARWCKAFERSTLGDTPEARAAGERERQALLAAIDASPGVANLASNPLLLTILALIKRQGVTLPNRRIELYELYLKTLISAWGKARALDRHPVGPEMDYLTTVAVLGPLALWLREENPTAGLVPEERLLNWLAGYYQGPEWELKPGLAAERARTFLDSVRKYSNLILERGQGRYGFIHLTFEEALAARGLVQAGQLKLEDSLAVIDRHLADPAWRETLLLAVGVWGLVREQPLVAGKAVRHMLQAACTGDGAGKNVLLAGACLEDVGEVGLGRAAAGEVTQALLAAARDRALPPTVQRDASFVLGRTGWAPADLDALIAIPAGPFLYGEDKKTARIEQGYGIGKYPVTNLQYGRFVQAGGYDDRQWWSGEGWAWRTGTYESKASEDYKLWLAQRPVEKRHEPFYWHDARWNNPLAPVVGVCWFEAEAYCKWLAAEQGRPIRLPSEEEWERAARHTDGREYPWDGPFDRERLNSDEFWTGEDGRKPRERVGIVERMLASTTMVGQFAAGDSRAGVSDMSGNVWEWTYSWYDRAAEQRALRGGSWNDLGRYARCAYRYKYVPHYFYNTLGFRVVSPGLSGS